MEYTDANVLRKKAKQACGLLKAVSNVERLMILCSLIKGEQSAGDLWKKSDLSQSAFSQHLAILRKDNLVSTRKEMQTVYYSLENDKAISLLILLHELYC